MLDIYIDSQKKDVILDLQIQKKSNYAPAIVAFDASKSRVQNDDIETFIYDYGDGTDPEQRDSINPWHRYLTPGTYNVSLTVKTKKGEEHSVTKKFNLIEKPQNIEISSSLKKTKAFQEIDFSSHKSHGQINSYFWEFWDGTFANTANPSKTYETPWEYTVKLTGTFENNNVETDEITVIIEE